jgi:primosomal protein N'
MSAEIVNLGQAREQRASVTLPEIEEEIRAYRSLNDRPQAGPIDFDEIADAALRRYDEWQKAAWEAYSHRHPNRKRAKYLTPDQSRPWDVREAGQPTVTQRATNETEVALLELLRGDPHRASERLRCAARIIERALERLQERKVQVAKREREEKRRERQREQIEQEERRLAREREQARKRLEQGGAA